MSESSFVERFGLAGPLAVEDFPRDARASLRFVLEDLVQRDFVANDSNLVHEARRIRGDIEITDKGDRAELIESIFSMPWPRLFQFCERVYLRCLQAAGNGDEGYWSESTSIDDVRAYYTEEINTLLSENNMGYVFVSGKFQRQGHPSTQKATHRVGSVLAQPRFVSVRNLYLKAMRFFQQMPEPDSVNCIKEAMCALEACLSSITDEDASKQFDRALRSLRGDGAGRLPGALAESMSKLNGYRGDGKGVAHAALDGSHVSPLEAELVLTLVAAYITYLADLVPEDEEIPF